MLKDFNSLMDENLKYLQNRLQRVNIGRASPCVLEKIKVDAYEKSVYLNSVANITIVDSSNLQIDVWDKNLMNNVDKAIKTAKIGLNPINKGDFLLVPFPRPSQEWRIDLKKFVSTLGEEAKITMRNSRRQEIQKIKKMEKEKEISKDQCKDFLVDVDNVTTEYTNKISVIIEHKIHDIMHV